MGDQSLLKFDSLTINGEDLPFEDNSLTVTGVARFSSKTVTAGSGPDHEQFSREATTISFRLLIGPKISVDDIKKIRNARAVLKDSNGPRRALAPNVSFGSMGVVGNGPTDVTLNVLEDIQWL